MKKFRDLQDELDELSDKTGTVYAQLREKVLNAEYDAKHYQDDRDAWKARALKAELYMRYGGRHEALKAESPLHWERLVQDEREALWQERFRRANEQSAFWKDRALRAEGNLCQNENTPHTVVKTGDIPGWKERALKSEMKEHQERLRSLKDEHEERLRSLEDE